MNDIITRDQNKTSAVESGTSATLFSANDADKEYMGVAQGAEQIIFEMLSDLSVDRGTYVLREAYSNAVDATRAAGDMSKPIEIELPETSDGSEYGHDSGQGIAGKLMTADNDMEKTAAKTVRISDSGIGMSENDIRRYFIQYGGSKKRDDKDAIGSKGLGAKAPLAITDTFEVISRHDGIETVAVITREQNANYARISAHPTDKHNGTDILIPVNDDGTIKQMYECANLLAFYNADANLIINGKHYPTINDNDKLVYAGLLTIGKDDNGNDVMMPLYHTKDACPSASDAAVLVIGGYPYALDSSYYYKNDITTTDQWVILGQPGYLNFTPSRDEIRHDDYYEHIRTAVRSAIGKHDMSLYEHNMLDGASLSEKLAYLSLSNLYDWKLTDDGNYSARYDVSSSNSFVINHDDVMFEGLDIVDVLNLVNGNANNIFLQPNADDTPAMTFIHYDESDLYKWNINDISRKNLRDMMTGYASESLAHHSYYWNFVLKDCRRGYSVNTLPTYDALVIVGVDDITDEKTIKYCLNNRKAVAEKYCAPINDMTHIAYMLVPEGTTYSKPIEHMLSIMAKQIVYISYGELQAYVKQYNKAHKQPRTRRAPNAPKQRKTIAETVSGLSSLSDIAECVIFANQASRQLNNYTTLTLEDNDYKDTLFAITESRYIETALFVLSYLNMNDAFDKRYDKACILRKPYATDIKDISKHDGIIAFDYRPSAKFNAKRYDDVCVLKDDSTIAGLSCDGSYGFDLAVPSLPERIRNAYFIDDILNHGYRYDYGPVVYKLIKEDVIDNVPERFHEYIDEDALAMLNLLNANRINLLMTVAGSDMRNKMLNDINKELDLLFKAVSSNAIKDLIDAADESGLEDSEKQMIQMTLKQIIESRIDNFKSKELEAA